MENSAEEQFYHDDIGLLTQEDMAFVHSTLGRDILTVEELNVVLNNPELRAEVLDSPAILDALNKNRSNLCVSEFFYFTTTVRQVMLAADVTSEEYTQNVASSLVRMSNMRRKLLARSDSSAKYDKFDMNVLCKDAKHGRNMRVTCKMPPYEMVLEGMIHEKSEICDKGVMQADEGKK
jgi:hypothetical protein